MKAGNQKKYKKLKKRLAGLSAARYTTPQNRRARRCRATFSGLRFQQVNLARVIGYLNKVHLSGSFVSQNGNLFAELPNILRQGGNKSLGFMAILSKGLRGAGYLFDVL